MKITMPNGFIFEGTQAEYEAFLAYAEAQQTEELAVESSETYEYKVGDKVKVVANTAGWGNPERVGFHVEGQGAVDVGAIGEVTSVVCDFVYAKFEDGGIGSAKNDLKLRTDEIVLTQSDEVITFEGEQYRKVDRKAQAGDVFVINHNDGGLPTWFTVGKPYKAIAPTDSTEEVSVIADDGDDLHVYNDGLGRTTETIDVYEKVEAKQSSYVPQEGDIVVITANTNGSRNKVGDVGKVGKITDSYTVAVDVPQRPRTYTANGNYTKFTEFRKATPAEVAQYEQALADASKPEVKAPVLKAGDYVKFFKYGHYTLDISLNKPYLVYEDGGNLKFDDDVYEYRIAPLIEDADCYEIIPTDEAKWAKLGREPGEYKAGDIVRIVKEGSSGFIKGTLGVVDEDCNDGDDCPRVTAYAADEGEVATYWEKVELVAPVESTLI